MVLLENPVGSNQILTLQQLNDQVAQLFDLPKAMTLFYDGKCKEKLGNVTEELNGKTLFLTPTQGSVHAGSACCPFINVTLGKTKACLLLQNPLGTPVQFVGKTLEAIFQKKVKQLDKQDVDQVVLEKIKVGQSLTAS